ncbi:MAG: UDP-N-acetylmuramoyl-L-alanyl-D-glutamate--2,6-diaminopimelate ligase [Desulfobulbaceae bacterium]|jgi:murE/murF fusion protein|nr:UDP-N-acetylmuramoyl-L-alanyl-D-glutamate--2,6-diaminopimelate ligase [Desulfobulbaceae bacterium]
MTDAVRHAMNLVELLSGVAAPTPVDVAVRGLTADSRQVRPGDVFVAMRGEKADGHRFLGQAIETGANALVVQSGLWSPEALSDWRGPLIEVADSRLAYALMAANYHGRPAEALRLFAVTGTNGKTTVSYLLEQCLRAVGQTVGVIGTINYRYVGKNHETVIAPAPNTTPDALVLQSLLRRMADAGVKTVIMEVSSHALNQRRLGDLRFDFAAFTNLSQDHLDYHADMAAYFAAKRLLFRQHLKKNGVAIINFPAEAQSDWSYNLADYCHKEGIKHIRCGLGRQSAENGLYLTSINSDISGSRLQLAGRFGRFNLTSPLVGGFNGENLLTAAALLLASGLDIAALQDGLAQASGAPGRLQRLEITKLAASRPTVFVDYAHTPDAVRKVLTTMRALPHKRLFCVLGCGGDRDKTKRPLMGRAAAALADILLVTDDNPRSENPETIRQEIESGLEASRLPERDTDWLLNSSDKGFVNIGDRSRAISLAIQAARAGDIVAILGKGHEQYQQGQHGKIFFDDCLEALTALAAWRFADLVAATDGRLEAGRSENRLAAAATICTDSRSLAADNVFLALKGDRFDGHDFQEKARKAGAGCLIIERGRKIPDIDIPCIEVADTRIALHDLAAFRRRIMAEIGQPTVFAITGSCGKTTTKEMLAAILRAHYPEGPDHPADRVLATIGNLNNLIGLPLTLLRISPRHRAAALEMGMNVPDEIARMARTANPDICCITNVRGVHLEGLGDIEGVARAKEELFAEAGDKATLIINGDDPRIMAMAERYRQRQIIFSAQGKTACPQAHLWAEDICEKEDHITFRLRQSAMAAPITLPLIGRHQVECALAACACAVAAAIRLETIAQGLAALQAVDKRMNVGWTRHGVKLINDSYNANPASMAAALATLRNQAAGKKSLAILGDMLELGEKSAALHEQLGKEAAELGISFLAAVGAAAAHLATAAAQAGMPPASTRAFADKNELVAWVERLIEAGDLTQSDVILVKGSRGMRMETVVEALVNTTNK